MHDQLRQTLTCSFAYMSGYKAATPRLLTAKMQSRQDAKKGNSTVKLKIIRMFLVSHFALSQRFGKRARTEGRPMVG